MKYFLTILNIIAIISALVAICFVYQTYYAANSFDFEYANELKERTKTVEVEEVEEEEIDEAMLNWVIMCESSGNHLDVWGAEEVKPIVDYYANKYNVNSDGIMRMIMCESSFDLCAWNKKDPRGGSKGLLQFQEPTFLQFAKEFGIENPYIYNPLQQIEITAHLIAEKKLALWTCGYTYDIPNTK